MGRPRLRERKPRGQAFHDAAESDSVAEFGEEIDSLDAELWRDILDSIPERHVKWVHALISQGYFPAVCEGVNCYAKTDEKVFYCPAAWLGEKYKQIA